MRKEFAQTIEDLASNDEKIIFITGDLGFGALEEIRDAIGPRFINGGVSEQNIISVAAALASEGLKPICYSIAPFIVFRPAEQIRIDICLHNLNVTIVGNGGGYGYGIMGATHHAIEDIAVLSSFQNMRCFVPWCNEDASAVVRKAIANNGPTYIRLGAGSKPEGIELKGDRAIRKIISSELPATTIVAIGPVALNAIEAIYARQPDQDIDMFVVSEVPFDSINPELEASLKKTKSLIVVEEHVSRGGLAEKLLLELAKKNIKINKFTHLCGVGYPNGKYGSQKYHQAQSGLDSQSIYRSIDNVTKKR